MEGNLERGETDVSIGVVVIPPPPRSGIMASEEAGLCGVLRLIFDS